MDKRPNILFCISDDQSWPHASAYGCQWVNTPAFDRVAREGILFNNAFTPNAKCAPSRAAILTGRYSWQLQEACNHLCFFPSEYVTFQEIFATLYHNIGIDVTATTVRDLQGRPNFLLDPSVEPLNELV